MKEQIYKYLGNKGIDVDESIDSLINECIELVKNKAGFKYIYQEFTTTFPFLENKDYQELLSNTSSYLLIGTTLGIEIDRLIKYYEKIDLTKSVILDAVASAYLEYKADLYEKNMNRELTFRFCPGYGNTSLEDNRQIHQIIKADKFLGITLLDTNLMVPLKSMLGVIGVGKNMNKNCNNCILKKGCLYRKEGMTCYKK